MTTTDLVTTDVERGAIQLLLDLEREGKADEVSLVITDVDLPYETWEALGRFLGSIDRRSRWYIGDWLNFGEAIYGQDASQGVEATQAERYSEAERVTGLDHGTLMNVASICGRVARSRRRSELGFWIHAEVAALEADEQVKWLEIAVEEGLKRNELRDRIREATRPPAPDPSEDPPEEGEPRMTRAEVIEQAARRVYHQGQPTSEGGALVPAEPWAALTAALGEE